jgi:membrane protein required for colicin V production
MSSVQLTLFDIIVIAVVLLSALAALMHGFVREILGLASWLGAAIVAASWRTCVAPLVGP